MRRARAFLYVCAGLLCLAVTYHLGARSATAQGPGNPIVASWESGYGGGTPSIAITANGDVYAGGIQGQGPWTLRGNVFGGGPTPAQAETWGAMKSRYRGERGAAQQTPQDK